MKQSRHELQMFAGNLCNALCILALLGAPLQASAHGTVGNRMDDVNHALEHEPDAAALYLKRGRIHQEKQAWEKALTDYQRAQQLDKSLHEVIYWTGMLYFEQQQYPTAEHYLQDYTKRSHSPQGHIALGELYLQTGKAEASALHYDKAIQLDANPPPGLYLKRARALMQAHPAPQSAKKLRNIVAGIDQGITRHGELVTYLELLIGLYTSNGDYPRALATIARLPENVRTTPAWQLSKAELLLRTGDRKAAATEYLATLTAIEQLPEHRRNVKANADVKQQAQLALDKLETTQTTE